jgi:exodeoxyribonuclease VII large subunit
MEWQRATGERLGMAAGRLAAEGRHLRALSPSRVLERGYAVVRSASGEVVRQASQVASGDEVHIGLAFGSLRATVSAAHE